MREGMRAGAGKGLVGQVILDAGADASTTLNGEAGRDAGRSDHLELVTLDATGSAVFPLPAAGSMSIGRGKECEVRVQDALVSRRHAILHLGPLSIEDTGSANGTELAGERLLPGVRSRIEPGHAVRVGHTLLIVRPSGARAGSVEQDTGVRELSPPGTVVCDEAMKAIFENVALLARGNINVLIVGETGVGKEIVAEALHRASPRSAAPLVRINCASLSDNLLESELFGHERGAFTGACAAKPGVIELADHGTVFLDEVGELAPSLQARLLRLIEAREVMRVGGVRPRIVDVRFIFATNRDLSGDVDAGKFRADLFFRLSGAVVHVPPLRERRAEIIPIAEACLARAAAELGFRGVPTLTADARERLLAHSWPGNVRELRNAIERALLLGGSSAVRAEHLALELASIGSPRATPSTMPRATSSSTAPSSSKTPGACEEQSERARFAQALLECAGNQRRAAEVLGIPRRTFVRRMTEFGLPRPRRAN